MILCDLLFSLLRYSSGIQKALAGLFMLLYLGFSLDHPLGKGKRVLKKPFWEKKVNIEIEE